MKGGRGRNGRRALLERSDLITGKRTKRTKVEQAEPFRQARAGSPRPAEAGRNKFALNEPGSSKARPGSAPITTIITIVVIFFRLIFNIRAQLTENIVHQ